MATVKIAEYQTVKIISSPLERKKTVITPTPSMVDQTKKNSYHSYPIHGRPDQEEQLSLLPHL